MEPTKGGQGRTSDEVSATSDAIGAMVLVAAVVFGEMAVFHWGGTSAGLVSICVAAVVGVVAGFYGWGVGDRSGRQAERERIAKGVDAIGGRVRT